jgi:aldehyde dehydrogenase (NAD+)
MEIKKIFEKQKNIFYTNITKDYAFRIEKLNQLEKGIKVFQSEIEEALFKDLHKSEFERYATEIGFILRSIRMVRNDLKKWMNPKKIKTPLSQLGSKSYEKYEPKGTVLIIGPFNYPFQLLIEPLIGAIAAGNTAIIKPSEQTPNTEKAIVKMIENTFDESYISVVTGSKEIVTELLELPFDHIFFTGSTSVGKIVYQAASNHLTPVTLELGGKSPTIIDHTAKLDIAARRIVNGKWMNAGQTCIAPDYIYIDERVKEPFIQELKKTIQAFYPEKTNDYSHIVTSHHLSRLKTLIDEKKVVYTQASLEGNHLPPVVLDDVTWNDEVMKEEIFGPILPILTFKHISEAIQRIKSEPKPLALYLFSEDKATQEKVFHELSFGNGAINDTLFQVANPHLSFGGVGASGIGSYHGVQSFVEFSHKKTYMKKSTKIDPKILYPPYDASQIKWIKKLLK